MQVAWRLTCVFDPSWPGDIPTQCLLTCPRVSVEIQCCWLANRNPRRWPFVIVKRGSSMVLTSLKVRGVKTEKAQVKLVAVIISLAAVWCCPPLSLSLSWLAYPLPSSFPCGLFPFFHWWLDVGGDSVSSRAPSGTSAIWAILGLAGFHVLYFPGFRAVCVGRTSASGLTSWRVPMQREMCTSFLACRELQQLRIQ